MAVAIHRGAVGPGGSVVHETGTRKRDCSFEQANVKKLTGSSMHPYRTGPFRQLLVRIASGLLFACLASVVLAQSPPVQTKTFLWKIASPTATVHLLGSVHVASQDIYPLDPRIESAFQRAQTLVLETSLDPAAQVQAGQKLAAAGIYPPGDSIDLHLDRDTLGLLQQRLKKSGAPFTTVRSYRPWFVAVILVLAEMQRLGYHPHLGIDTYFAERAKDRKRIVGLETIDEQVALFSGMSDTLQEGMLKDALAKLDELAALMPKAQSQWRTGDAKAIDELLVAPMRKDFPDVFQKLFVDRNRRMATAIEGYLRITGEYFVVVGSGHLIGPEGILELLQAKGYVPVQQ
jgi:uncharacterized protein YbaP (TraB family)